MANKRMLKQSIKLVCEELIAECLAASLYGHNPDGAEALCYSVIRTQADYISRISHPEPGMPQHQYYKTLHEDFIKQINDIIDQINNL